MFDHYCTDTDQLLESIRICETRDGSEPGWSYSTHDIVSFEALASYLETAQSIPYKCRLISFCQQTSRRPLQTTQPMLDLIFAEHKISPSAWNIPSCFYKRRLDLEEVFSVPYTESRTGSIIEISYTIRYPEFKPDKSRWVIRQTGIYHRHDTATQQNVFLLFNPNPWSKAHRQIEDWLQKRGGEEHSDLLWIHRLLFSVYLPEWRQYIASLEHEFLPIADRLVTVFINEPLRVGHENLVALSRLQSRFLQIPTILATANETLEGLRSLCDSTAQTERAQTNRRELGNIQRQCTNYSRNADHLHSRAELSARLLADTLSLRDQVVAREQNQNIFQLNKSGVFLTSLGLVYLPSSFIASFFGMNFFDLDQTSHRIVGTSMIWIFVVAALSLTAVTFLFYYGLLHRDGSFFRRISPKGNIAQDWNLSAIKRQLTFNRGADIELQDSKAG